MSSRVERARMDRAPAAPRFSLAEWRATLRRAGGGFLADDCLGLSQQVAYSSLLAFFPAMLFLVGLLGIVDGYDELRSFLAPIAPADVLATIDTLQRESQGASSVVALLVGAIGAVWAASGAMASVIKAVNRAYELVETRRAWNVRLTAVALVGLTAVSTAGVFLLIVFGGPLGTAIADYAGLGGAFELLWAVLRWPLAFLVVLLFFALVYALAPNARVRSWRWITPGSVVGSLAWLALSALFALYTSALHPYSKTYGTLASGIVLLLWLNYSAVALLFGAELNAELDRQAEIRAAGAVRRPSPTRASELRAGRSESATRPS